MYKITCRLLDAASVSEIMSVEDDKSSLSAPGTSTPSDAATVVDVGSVSQELPVSIIPRNTMISFKETEVTISRDEDQNIKRTE